MKRAWLGVGILSALILGGCTKAIDMNEEGTLPGATSAKTAKFTAQADAGLPVAQANDPNRFKTLVAAKADTWGPTRKDPFSLMSDETAFDEQQRVERVFSETGGYRLEYQEPPNTDLELPVTEPQPYRRLSGIIVGDSVLAILESSDGRPPEIIRPGMKLPGTPWEVASIDQDKAILRRSGNVLPKIVVVRLESPPAGAAGNVQGIPGVGGNNGFPGGAGGFGPPGRGGGGRGGDGGD